MKITVLGSGTSSGVPFIGCFCPVCTSSNPKNRRFRSSCLISVNGKNILVDTTPDLRAQALDNRISRIDAVLYTHTHADHLHGIDDLRTFCILQQGSIPIYGRKGTLDEIVSRFSYIFNRGAYAPGGKPQLVPNSVDGDFSLFGMTIRMIPLMHGKIDNVGYRVGDAAWLTDTNGIYPEGYEKLKGLKVLFLDALRRKPHESHYCLDEALKAAEKIGAQRTVLIHLTHDYDQDVDNVGLPTGIELAYDGMTIEH